jgi:hypothetical protein|tara:strand:+ start:428 stop:1600 length:1173 start_codon:yes stop_codon:yes gene_type:complete
MALTTVSSDRLSTNVKNTNFTAAEKQDLTDDILPLAGQIGNRNKVINGEMLCAQRGVSFSPNASAQIYTLDRFQHVATSGVAFDCTVTQDSSAPAGFSKSYKVTPDAADTPSGGGNGTIRTKIEGQDVQDLAYGGSDAKKVTVSFYAKSASQNNGHQYTFQLRHFATDGTQRSINAPFTITSSFQRFTFTFVGDTAVDIIKTEAVGLELCWHLAAGPDDIASQHTTWVTTNLFTCVTGQSNFMSSTSNEFYLTGVQLEVSDFATSFEHRSFAEELALCQRYYFRFTTSVSGTHVGMGHQMTSSAAKIILPFPTSMRARPTAVETTGTASDYTVARTSTYEVCNVVPTFAGASKEVANVNTNQTQASLSTGIAVVLRANTTAFYLGFSAEL